MDNSKLVWTFVKGVAPNVGAHGRSETAILSTTEAHTRRRQLPSRPHLLSMGTCDAFQPPISAVLERYVDMRRQSSDTGRQKLQPASSCASRVMVTAARSFL